MEQLEQSIYEVHVFTALGEKKMEIHQLIGPDTKYFVKIIVPTQQGLMPLTFKIDAESVEEAFSKAEGTVMQGIQDLRTKVQPASRIIT